MSEALNTKKKQGEILEILEAHDDHVAYESMGGDGRFHLTSESIFNDQEHTDLPPDKVDSDFECHEMYVHLNLQMMFTQSIRLLQFAVCQQIDQLMLSIWTILQDHLIQLLI